MEDFDDEIDFKKLQKEMKNAVYRDEKYQRENDAKFRAVSQKVATYEEFRDIVEASHLKSLNREDKLGGISYQKWNSISESNSKMGVKLPEELGPKKQGFNPKNYEEFMKIWRRFKVEERVDFLMGFDRELLENFFKIECPLGEIVSVLDEVSDSEQYRKVAEVLELASRSKRFSIQRSFLNKSETEILAKLFQNLENYFKDISSFAEIKKLYKL